MHNSNVWDDMILANVCGALNHWSVYAIELSITESKTKLQRVNPFNPKPHQNAFWYNNSWLGFLQKKWALICHS